MNGVPVPNDGPYSAKILRYSTCHGLKLKEVPQGSHTHLTEPPAHLLLLWKTGKQGTQEAAGGIHFCRLELVRPGQVLARTIWYVEQKLTVQDREACTRHRQTTGCLVLMSNRRTASSFDMDVVGMAAATEG